MLPEKEVRPQADDLEARKSTTATGSKSSIAIQADEYADVAAPLRRRREAARRLEPIGGYRDPLDSYTTISESTFRPAWIITDEARGIFVVRGRGVADVLRRAGLKPIFSGARRGYLLDLRRLPDALAALEWAGYRVAVRDRGDVA